MSRFTVAILLAIYTCIGWGSVTPTIVKMSKDLGPRFDPLSPFVWNFFGNAALFLVMMFLTRFSPVTGLQWHWAGWIILLLWPTAGLAITYAVQLVPGKESVPNVISTAYPALVGAPLLWYFLGETMSPQKVFFILLTAAGVIGTIFTSK